MQILAYHSSICLMLATVKKQKVIKKYQKHDKDTGSAEVQAAVLTERIEELAGHLKKHRKDLHSRRGLVKLVAERRKHLKYLEKYNKTKYDETLKRLKLD